MGQHLGDAPARLLIAEHRLVRLGLRMAVDAVETLDVCAEAASADEAISEAERNRPDVCIVGWGVAGGALNAVRGISEAVSSPTVVLANTLDVDGLLSAMEAGAAGYVSGDVSSDGLRRVVRAVLRDEVVVPRMMVRDLIFALRPTTVAGLNVSGREAQVLSLLRRGQSTAQIGARLQMSPVTVRRHISNLVRKLGVEDRTGLVRSAGTDGHYRSDISFCADGGGRRSSDAVANGVNGSLDSVFHP